MFPLLKKIPVRHIASLVDVLEGLGIDREEFLLTANIDAAEIDSKENHFELQHYLSVVQTALDISQCMDLGFRVGKHSASLDQGNLGYALPSGTTLRESLSRYQYLTGSNFTITLTVEGEFARLTARPPRQNILLSESQTSYLTQAWLASWSQWRPLICEPDGFFEHVYLGYREDCDPEIYTSHMGCGVTFGHQQTTAVFPATYLDRILDLTAEAIDSTCSAQRDRLDINLDIKSRGIIVDIHSLLAKSPGRIPNMKEMADSLDLSPRTLRRRLLSENRTYQQLIIDFRLAVARRYLQSTNIPANEIASLVGYADTANFYRTFRGKIGMTPAAFRRAEQSSAGTDSSPGVVNPLVTEAVDSKEK